MRKIEKMMINAIQRNAEWCLDNTRVVPDGEGGCDVYLHDNHIAYVGNKRSVNMETWRRWPTRTTSSRLKALGFTYNKNSSDWS